MTHPHTYTHTHAKYCIVCNCYIYCERPYFRGSPFDSIYYSLKGTFKHERIYNTIWNCFIAFFSSTSNVIKAFAVFLSMLVVAAHFLYFLFVCLFLAKVKSYPELDEEIDVLSAIISEQRTESRLPGNRKTLFSSCMRMSVSTPLEGLFLFVTAPPVRDFSESESGLTHGAATTVRPTNQSVAFTSVAVPATTVNHTTGLLSDPIIFPYPSNDHVFISKSFRSFNRIFSVTVTDKRSVSCLQKKTRLGFKRANKLIAASY